MSSGISQTTSQPNLPLDPALDQEPSASRPLADRMRPRTLADFEGQEHLLGEGRPLRELADHGVVHSMVLWGPPGTGKTTLARLLSDAAGAEWRSLSAVLAGALAGSIALATLLGVIIPLGLKWRGVDPALAANIFVTGATDILSFVLFLGLAALVIERIA